LGFDKIIQQIQELNIMDDYDLFSETEEESRKKLETEARIRRIVVLVFLGIMVISMVLSRCRI
jgi:hypothetical protein